ncbi:hypothetical protein CR205_04240 [Alteribacter lacisalsi]|uniref:Uncharacterized protein n=1 Tax=Alteribacter lacisalsi TaxID=2045244 RepID=A0A2W0HA79_9BACI|nr:hypothetical protein [Alteribacter lacisalsi]PYZ97811.1 hypothetical protein CR205_04240 [Alteribacter lacisalsi]
MKKIHITFSLFGLSLMLLFSAAVIQPQSKGLTAASDYTKEASVLADRNTEVKGVSAQEMFEYERLFQDAAFRIGEDEEAVHSKREQPDEEGMYNGGSYYDFGTYTYFADPEQKRINAVAVRGETAAGIDQEPFFNELEGKMITSGYNEMDGTWMEIYRVNGGDLVIEREEEQSAPAFIWLTEPGLFHDE